MRHLGQILVFGLIGAGLCACRDNSPAVAPAIPPEVGRDTYRKEADYPKPLPDSAAIRPVAPGAMVRPPAENNDATTVDRASFVEMYRKVNRPRIAVFVNRDLNGQIVAVAGAERDAEMAKAGVGDARGLDLGAMESTLAKAVSSGGEVTVISPAEVREKLSEQDAADLEQGKASALNALGQAVGAHVLIQVQPRPIRQSPAGAEVRVWAEAMNVRDGSVLATANVDIAPPLNQAQVNKSTQALAQKLLDEVAATWSRPIPAGQANKPLAPVEKSSAEVAPEKATVPVGDEPAKPAPKKLPAPLPPPPPINQ